VCDGLQLLRVQALKPGRKVRHGGSIQETEYRIQDSDSAPDMERRRAAHGWRLRVWVA
jgi:hypothetical protein